MEPIYPPALTANSKFAVVTPSSPAPIHFPIRFERALLSFQSMGYGIELGPSSTRNIVKEENFALIAANEFNGLIERADIDAIIFSTGGHLTNLMLPYIDWENIAKKPKIIIGYSDATALLIAIYIKTGLVVYHGPMLISEFGESGGIWDYTYKHFYSVLSGYNEMVLFPPSEWTNEFLFWDKEDIRKRRVSGIGQWRFLKSGKAQGTLFGGNLSTLSLLAGTEYFQIASPIILFIEDEGFSPEKLLAYLTRFKYIGFLNHVIGFVAGRHSHPQFSRDLSFEWVIVSVFEGMDIPIIIDVDIGHTEPMLTLPIGGTAILDSERNVFKLIRG